MTLTAATVGSRSTTPALLVQLGTSMRLSSRETMTSGGYTWTAADVRLTAHTSDGTGSDSLRLDLADADSAWPPLILAGLDADMACAVWLAYRDAAGALETEQIFSGVVRQASTRFADGIQRVDIDAVGHAPDVTWTPRISWVSPYAVRKGTEITVNNETFRLE